MMWFTHVAFGLFLGLLSLRFISVPYPQLYVFIAAVAALLPDIDHPNSVINKKFTLTRWASHLFKHRGFFHSVFPVVLLYLVIAPLHHMVAAAVCLGYLSHLVADGFTKMGVNLLYPLITLRIQGPLETGKAYEWLIFMVIAVVDLMLAV